MKIIPPLVACLERKLAGRGALVSLYANYYRDVVKKEIDLAGVSRNDRVLHVGCGGIPFTAILIAKLTGAHVWAIDCDDRAVAVARACVAAQKLEPLITIMHLDGTAEIPFPFDVALVALQAKPKKEILENLQFAGGCKARLVFRRPRRQVAHQYDLLPARQPVCGAVIQEKATFDCSVLYAGYG